MIATPDRYDCPDNGDCYIKDVSCPSFLDSDYRTCNVYRARHTLETATALLNEIDVNGQKQTNIPPELIEERLSDIKLMEMPDSMKRVVYSVVDKTRMAVRSASMEAVEAGCRPDKYIKSLQKIENQFTNMLRELEKEGIDRGSDETADAA